MNRLLPSALLALAFAIAIPGHAQTTPPQARAYAPENLRSLSYNDRVRVISLEYSEQSGGRRIPDDQLRFYLDQVNRSNWGFSRIKADIATSLDNVGVQPPRPTPGRSVRCESLNNKSQTCRVPWSGPSRLSRQLSSDPCREGVSWQSQQGQVYVGNGCRAEFVAAAQGLPTPGRSVRCESINNKAQTCRVPWSGPSRLSRQLSSDPCREGVSWQSQQGQVYVGHGCRAEFVAAAQVLPPPRPTPGGSVRCESINNKAQICRVPWSGPSRLSRQLSSDPCREGFSWQSQQGQVYVGHGCRAEFVPAATPR